MKKTLQDLLQFLLSHLKTLQLPRSKTIIASITTLLLTSGFLSVPSPASAYENPVPIDLGTAASYSVIIGGALTNAGGTTLSGSLGVSPAAAVATGVTVDGVINNGNADATQAYADMNSAYDEALGRTFNAAFVASGNATYPAGVYAISGASAPAIITLNGNNNPNSVFIFQINGALDPSGIMVLTNGAQSGNVFWQVNGAFSPCAGAHVIGTVMA